MAEPARSSAASAVNTSAAPHTGKPEPLHLLRCFLLTLARQPRDWLKWGAQYSSSAGTFPRRLGLTILPWPGTAAARCLTRPRAGRGPSWRRLLRVWLGPQARLSYHRSVAVGMRDERRDLQRWPDLPRVRRATPAGHGGGVRRDPEPPAEPVITQKEATACPPATLHHNQGMIVKTTHTVAFPLFFALA